MKNSGRILRGYVRRCVVACLALSLMGSSALLTAAPSSEADAQPLAMPQPGAPPTRRALLVGINIYKPETKSPIENPSASKPDAAKSEGAGRGEFSNLSGPQNDVKEMQAVISKKYGFTDIRTLEDQQATRDAILKAIDELIERSAKGDIALFYYSGHGSRVRNSKNGEAKGYDESIVPADSNRGALDIRDKELARWFLKAIDKGVTLTAIFDSCHSGSVARGGNNPAEKSRALPFDERDVQDAPDFASPPEAKGALILSAAQDYEQAKERLYDGKWRGNFSWALIEVLKDETTLKDDPADLIFQRAVALMTNKEVREQPVFAGVTSRHHSTLFDATPSKATIPTAAISSIDENEFELRGGRAMGVGVGSELKQRDAVKDVKPIRLRVTELLGLSGCRAQAVEGNYKTVRVGDVFVIDRWVAQNANTLKVWMPPAIDENQLRTIVQNLQTLQKSSRAQLVNDPADTAPARFIQYGEAGWQEWLTGGKTETLSDVAAFTSMAVSPSHTFFISLPPTIALRDAMKFGPKTSLPAIVLARSPQEAQYVLAGRLRDDGQPEYAWVRPGVTNEAAEKGGDPMPVRSDWLTGADDLQAAAVSLSRGNGWRELKSSAAEPFPFKLALKNMETGELVEGGAVYQGQRYGLVLVPQGAAMKASPAHPIRRQRVYVFSIDSYGKSILMFPAKAGGNVENLLPLDPDKPVTEPIVLPILGNQKAVLRMAPPFGLDTYILLASDDSIPDPSVLEFDGARSKSADTRGAQNNSALSRLAYGLGSGTRGPTPDAPLDWTIEKIFLRSKSPQ